MSLRYKGLPFASANIQADKPLPLCFCKFIEVGYRMDSTKCEVHTDRAYKCGALGCLCHDYRPNGVKRYPLHWPVCVCGHIAQEH